MVQFSGCVFVYDSLGGRFNREHDLVETSFFEQKQELPVNREPAPFPFEEVYQIDPVDIRNLESHVPNPRKNLADTALLREERIVLKVELLYAKLLKPSGFLHDAVN